MAHVAAGSGGWRAFNPFVAGATGKAVLGLVSVDRHHESAKPIRTDKLRGLRLSVAPKPLRMD